MSTISPLEVKRYFFIISQRFFESCAIFSANVQVGVCAETTHVNFNVVVSAGAIGVVIYGLAVDLWTFYFTEKFLVVQTW